MNAVKWLLLTLMILMTNTAAMDGKLDCKHCGKTIGSTAHGKAGNWMRGTLPHQNWKCVEVKELLSERQNCTMCSTPNLSIVHWMKHETLDFRITVDAICAGMMEGNAEAAQARQRKAELRAIRRAAWPTLEGWKTKGQYTTIEVRLEYDDKVHKIRIKEDGRRFFMDKLDGENRTLFVRYPTLDEAKEWTFNLLWPQKIQ